jgi:hypothetical protein
MGITGNDATLSCGNNSLVILDIVLQVENDTPEIRQSIIGAKMTVSNSNGDFEEFEAELDAEKKTMRAYIGRIGEVPGAAQAHGTIYFTGGLYDDASTPFKFKIGEKRMTKPVSAAPTTT